MEYIPHSLDMGPIPTEDSGQLGGEEGYNHHNT